MNLATGQPNHPDDQIYGKTFISLGEINLNKDSPEMLVELFKTRVSATVVGLLDQAIKIGWLTQAQADKAMVFV